MLDFVSVQRQTKIARAPTLSGHLKHTGRPVTGLRRIAVDQVKQVGVQLLWTRTGCILGKRIERP